jgi:DNA-binding transcriptional MerR regulator/methylmalonyl-CoA mutase cobalamin-binding subunit
MRENRPGPSLSISEVERDTGIAKDTLRIWERRYGFPNPARDAGGERSYDAAQVQALRLIKRLLDAGKRPGKIIGRTLDELTQLAAEQTAGVPAAPLPESADLEMLDILRSHDSRALDERLSHLLLKNGLHRFVIGVLAPLNVMIGEAWVRGDMTTFDEHLYSEAVQALLRAVLHGMPRHRGRPRILLTTFPQEQHGLGLLMVEALLAAEYATCVSLGTQTPVGDIADAAQAHQVDIVALSFSGSFPARLASDGIALLRKTLPPAIEVWVGGRGATRLGGLPLGVAHYDAIEEVLPALHRWRAGAH